MPAADPAILSIAMLAVFALVIGGVWTLRRRRGEALRGVLMLVAAAVLLGNVLIWSL